MLVADCGFVLQVPHQHVDKVRVFDNDGNLFKHVLEANAGLLQTEDAEIEKVKKKKKGREDAERRNDMNYNASTSFSNISTSEKVRMGML